MTLDRAIRFAQDCKNSKPECTYLVLKRTYSLLGMRYTDHIVTDKEAYGKTRGSTSDETVSIEVVKEV